MKRLKLMPSLIMLVLCVSILAVGVFALNPISNSISGTINISASKGNFAITGYVDDVVVYPRKQVHTKADLVIDSSSLNFDASSYCFPEEVPEKEIKLVIENLTNTALGVFFCDTANVNATESNIVTDAEVKSSSDSAKTILNAELDFYKYIAPANDENTFDQVEMLITLSVASLTGSTQTGSFNFNLNIEEYDPELNATGKFVKIADTETEIADAQFESNQDIESVVIPSSVTIINDFGFNYCCNLKNIFIPESVTYIGDCAFCCCCKNLTKIIVPNSVEFLSDSFTRCINLEEAIIGAKVVGGWTFDGCTNLKEVTITSTVTTINNSFSGCISLTKITVEAHSTSGDFGSSANLPSVDGAAWYVNGSSTPQTKLSYSTITRTYERENV